MSYKIHVRVIQTDPTASYSIVEKSVWRYANGGTWSSNDGDQVLTMGGSGTSGILRFKNPQDDYFMVAVGIHNYKRWCDVIVDASPSDTCVAIHPTYYGVEREEMLWKQAASIKKTSSKGVRVKVDFYKEEGLLHRATINIAST